MMAPHRAVRRRGRRARLIGLTRSDTVVRAIGNAADLDTRFALSDVASRYQTLSSAEGISFDFSEKDSLSLPANAPVTLRYARPVTPAPSGSSR